MSPLDTRPARQPTDAVRFVRETEVQRILETGLGRPAGNEEISLAIISGSRRPSTGIFPSTEWCVIGTSGRWKIRDLVPHRDFWRTITLCYLLPWLPGPAAHIESEELQNFNVQQKLPDQLRPFADHVAA
jgi:hypothetical protein